MKQKALRELVKDGLVARQGEGKRGNPYRYSVSTSLHPDICEEVEKRNQKNDQTPHKQRPDSTSQGSMDFEGSGESREQEKEGVLVEKNGVFEEVVDAT